MKKNILVWSLYDFANSIIMIVFLFYFSQWLVVDSGRPDWWYNATLVVSSVLFILTAPILARRLDENGRKLSGVRTTSVIMFALYLSTALVMLFAPAQAFIATVLFTLSMYVYLLSFIYYTPMLNDISDDSNRGWVSGVALGANYSGQVFGLLATLPFATGAVYLFGAHGRAQTLVPALILFAITAIPLMLWYTEPTRNLIIGKITVKEEYRKVISTLKLVFSFRNLALLLIAYFLFSDALLTFSNNFPVFLEKVFGVSDSVKIYLTAGTLALSGISSAIFGKMADKKGTKYTLSFLLIGWIILFPLLAFAPSFGIAAVICLIAGTLFGPVWGVSRAMVSEYSPREIEASSFGLYTVAERFATFIGPIAWSVTLAATAGQGATSYSYAIVIMGVLVLVGLVFIRKIRPVVR